MIPVLNNVHIFKFFYLDPIFPNGMFILNPHFINELSFFLCIFIILYMQEYKHFLEEAKKRDHRLLGQSQELFFFHQLRYLPNPI
jgi:hypothetical protein